MSTEITPDARAATETEDQAGLEALLDYLKRTRGFDFTGYKRASLTRRIAKRMHAAGIARYADYLDHLEVEPGEFVQLFNTILINVTDFFRDAETWEYLAREVVPATLERLGAGEPIRLWSAGCATGQEAYTLAMLFAEALGDEAYVSRVKVYATDVDDEALAYARHGSYSAKEVGSLSPERLERFFEVTDGRYCVRKEYRRSVIFGRNDLIQDAPISRIDVLACRNALMYFDADTQGRVMSRFHFALADGGVLVLGRAETMLTRTSLFTPVELKRRVFAKVPRLSGRMGLPSARALAVAPGELDFEVGEARDAAFNAGPVAQVVVDRAGQLTMINDRARAAFHLLKMDVGRPLQDLELSYRPTELRGPIAQAMRDRQPVTVRDVRWRGTNGEPRWYEVQVVPLVVAGEASGASVAFTDVTAFRQTQDRLEQAAQELEAAYEELQSTNEELETTNEELHSTVEELETTNEELQSTNEELETMNEELHSTNEELHSANDVLRAAGEEINAMNAFQEGIFTSLRWGIVVLDDALEVLKWNRRAEDLWGLRAEEAEGHPFLALDSGLPVAALAEAVTQCLHGTAAETEMVLPATNRLGRPIGCRFTLLPLRQARERRVRGVIVLMEETPVG